MLSLLLPLLAASPIQAADPAPPPVEDGVLLVLNKSEATMSLVDAATGAATDAWPTGDGPHEVAVSPDGRTAVVTDYGREIPGRTLTVLDLTGQAAPRTIELGEYRRPHGIAFEDARHVIVTAETNRALLRVDVEEGAVVATMPTRQDVSHMLALTPDRSHAFVANIGSGTCTAIELASGKLLAQIPTGAGAEGVAVHPEGLEVWVTNRAANTVTVIDAASLEVTAQLECGAFPIRVVFTPDGQHALVSCASSGDVAVFDARVKKLVTRIAMDSAAKETSGRLFGDTFGASPVPIGILVRPDGKRAYVACTNADLVTVLDLERWQVLDRWSAGAEPDGLGWTTVRFE